MMLDSADGLVLKIRLGEDSVLVLKQVSFRGERIEGPGRDDLADELAAIANTADGVLILGVDDKTRDIVGIPLERLDALEAYVREICIDSITPPVVIRTQRIELPDAAGDPKPVLKVDVQRGLFVHRSPGGHLHRQGSSKREMSPDMLARLFQHRSQTRLIRFEEQVVAGAEVSDLVSRHWERFRTERTRNGDEDLLAKLGMLRQDEDGTWRPTVAGVLMAAKDPRAWLPNAFVQAVAYRGTSQVPEGPRELYQLDARDIVGPADEQIIEACRFVQRNMKVMATKDIGRRDIPQFDLTAVFEAVVNAVAHRDCSMYGSKIRLRLFSDRLEIYSPGSLANTMTVESLAFRLASRDWPLERIVPDREAFFAFLQELWPIFLDRLAGGADAAHGPIKAPACGVAERSVRSSGLEFPGPPEIPFDHNEVRVYIDNLFLEGVLHQIPHPRPEKLADTWAIVGVKTEPKADRRRRLEGLLEVLAEASPGEAARHQDWLAFAHRWAQVSALWFDPDGQDSADPPAPARAAQAEKKEQSDASLRARVKEHFPGAIE